MSVRPIHHNGQHAARRRGVEDPAPPRLAMRQARFQAGSNGVQSTGDLQARQSSLKLLHSRVGDSSAAKVEFLEFGQPLQVHQARICDFGLRQAQHLQSRQSPEIDQAGVGDLAPVKIEDFDTGQLLQVSKTSVRNGRTPKPQLDQSRKMPDGDHILVRECA